MKTIRVLSGIFFLFALVLIAGCAKVGSLSGGPIDEDPPKIVSCTPPNYSTQFSDKRVEIEFDEFVVLNNVSGELIVSPPIEEKPDVRLKGKGIVIEIDEEYLKDSTTYTFNFGKSIVDNHEGNILSNFEYVFSTGDYVDSLSVKGRVIQAYNLHPLEDQMIVMLYDSLYDSIPYLSIPKYVGKTDKEGYFAVNNLKDDEYKVFALKDANSNLKFDMPTETIAFLDSTIELSVESTSKTVERIEELDSSYLQNLPDSIRNDNDSLRNDTLTKMYSNTLFINLLSFEEYHEKQYLTDNQRPDRRKLIIAFNLPVTETFNLVPLYRDSTDWHRIEYNSARDTVTCWLTDTSFVNSDSLHLIVHYQMPDSNDNNFIMADTINFRYHEEKKPKRKKNEVIIPEEEKLSFSFNFKNNITFGLGIPVKISSVYPIDSIDRTLIHVHAFEDTLEVPVPFSLERDSLSSLVYKVDFDIVPEKKYKLLVEPNAVANLYSLPHDTLLQSFTAQKEDAYGSIILSISNLNVPMIIQLYDRDEKRLINKQSISENTTYVVKYLRAGEYLLKAIYDTNENKKWDTGNYLSKKQPEKVTYFRDFVTVRTNWEVEVEWMLNAP